MGSLSKGCAPFFSGGAAAKESCIPGALVGIWWTPAPFKAGKWNHYSNDCAHAQRFKDCLCWSYQPEPNPNEALEAEVKENKETDVSNENTA